MENRYTHLKNWLHLYYNRMYSYFKRTTNKKPFEQLGTKDFYL
jgi:hypothetical protein